MDARQPLPRDAGDGDKALEIFSMMNPINRSDTLAKTDLYKVEPYVLAGDIYAEPPHVGRGGWTWYTGSSGWLYRAGTEWILGFRVRGTMLTSSTRAGTPSQLAGLIDRFPPVAPPPTI